MKYLKHFQKYSFKLNNKGASLSLSLSWKLFNIWRLIPEARIARLCDSSTFKALLSFRSHLYIRLCSEEDNDISCKISLSGCYVLKRSARLHRLPFPRSLTNDCGIKEDGNREPDQPPRARADQLHPRPDPLLLHADPREPGSAGQLHVRLRVLRHEAAPFVMQHVPGCSGDKRHRLPRDHLRRLAHAQAL